MNSVKSEIQKYAPVILLERVLPQKIRTTLTTVVAVIALSSLGALFFERAYISFSGIKLFPLSGEIFVGIALLFGSLAFGLLLLSFYRNALYYRGITTIMHEERAHDSGLTYESARIFYNSEADITEGFITSAYGRVVLLRCGITEADSNEFLLSPRDLIDASNFEIPEHGFMTLREIGEQVFLKDNSFKSFLADFAITEDMYLGALDWVVRQHHEFKYGKRWWSRDHLGKINGIGKEFSFGIAYELQKYLRDIRTTAVFSTLTSHSAYANEKINQLESILSRSKEANVIVVGEAGVGKMDVLIELGRRMQEGKTSSSITGKKLVALDGDSFISTHSTKQEFELSFLRMFTQAERAGNLIVVIEHIAKFFNSAGSIGVDVVELLDRFLSSSDVQLIGTSDPLSYHQSLEVMPQMIQRFDAVQIENPGHDSSIRVLEDVAARYELPGTFVVTYPAIVAVVDGADRYMTEGVMPDKAVDLLTEIISSSRQSGVTLLKKEHVQKYVSEKTGIPLGPINEVEREKLLHLEEELHRHVIGQHNAIGAISNAMRRARAGIQEAGKPIGSFLFLGSTGVGKTETSKALAKVIFGDKEKMSRLDMSEFSGADAISRLIGSDRNAGFLANKLREHPYGVLLLDEFEKASRDVHDLFLQILDEGVFADARGNRVSARNSVIIATSNAGSDLIWNMVREGKNPTESKADIIDHLIDGNIYRPELLNRFDGIIIFEPLTIEDQEKIARLMLEELRKRIEKRGYKLVIDEVLVNILVTKGYNPEFGAREMRRVLQDVIEEKIAEKIIAGNLKPGQEIWFYDSDFEDQKTSTQTHA